MDVAAFLIRKQIHVFQASYIVDRHDPILDSGRVTAHTAGVIAAKESVNVKADKVLVLFFRKKQRSLHRLFPAGKPRLQRISHKLQRLLFDIGEGRMLKVADHVRRDTEDSRDLIQLEFSRLQKLRLLRRDANGRVLHVE